MKQVVQDIRSGETQVVEVPVPVPGPGMALVRTAASLVSPGTERMLVEFAGKSLLGKARARPDLVRQTLDKARREGLLTALQAVTNRLDQPMPLGYSSAGTIVAAGEGLDGLRAGDRVACGGGGYAVHAEYAAVPRNLMALMPDSVEAEAAAFATLGAVALHGLRLANPQVGERVAVIGLGLLGLLAVGLASASGCTVLGIDVDPQRVALAASMGGRGALRAEAEATAADFAQGRGCDVVLICADTASDDPVELAGSIARDRAEVVAIGSVGMTIPRRLYYEKELTFRVSRSYGPGRYDPGYEQAGHDYPIGQVRWTEGRNLEAFVEMLASGRLDVRPLITHRYPIERAPEAYRLIADRQARPSLGVILTYPAVAEGGREHTVQIAHHPSGAAAPLRLGLLGAGNFATAVLLPALRGIRGIELVGVASAGGLRAQQAARRFGFRYAAADEAEILGDPGINAVAILTRHNQHARQTAAALRAGKHVFCEKPLALNPDELRVVGEALRGTDRVLAVGFNRRFAPLLVRLQAFLHAVPGPRLMLYRVNAGLLPPDHWLHDPVQGGGRIVGEACHFIDALTFLAGALPRRVSARGLADDGRYHEDNVALTLEFADGSLGTLLYAANGDRALPKERLEVFAGGRAAVLDDFRRLDLYAGGRRRSWRSAFRQDKGHGAEWRTFASAVAAGGPPPIAYEELFAVTQASFAAVQALRCGEAVAVEAPFPD